MQGIVMFNKIFYLMIYVSPILSQKTQLSDTDKNQHENSTSKTQLCLKPVCIHAASKLLKDLDFNINPCEDFYQFVCKNFIENQRLLGHKSKITKFTILDETLKNQQIKMFTSPATEKDIKPFKIVKEIYKSCMNTSALEIIRDSYVQKIFKQMGGWPVIEGETWNEVNFNFIESHYTAQRIGVAYDWLFKVQYITDYKNSSQLILYIDQPNLPLDRTYLIDGFENKYVSEYFKYKVDSAVLFGANREVASSELKDTLEFIFSLTNISADYREMRDETKLWHLMTLAELEKIYPIIPWTKFIQTLIPNQKFGPEEVVNIPNLSYLDKLTVLLRNTPKRVLANYILSYSAERTMSYLSNDFEKRNFEYEKIFSGNTEQSPRWLKCINAATNSMEIAASALYLKYYFNKETKLEAEDLAKRILTQMEDLLKNVGWMDEETRAAAIEKEKSILFLMAYTDEFLDETLIENYYKEIDVDPRNFYEAVLSCSKFTKIKYFEKFRKPNKRNDWENNISVLEINAWYIQITNLITLSASILQEPLFHKDYPKYLNYGAIGFFIGHEITHAFDDLGSLYDKDGNLKNWWKNETKEKFTNKANCIIKQYGSFVDEQVNLTLNGVITQGENIADNGGIKLAYKAYTALLKEIGLEEKLPGLEMFTPQQMVWISTANSFCALYRPESLRNEIKTNTHPPFKFRINGAFLNQKEFSNDFNCPIGSKMNPKEKCVVW